MISKECFTQEWVENVSQQLHYPDKNLIEKVIRAFALIDMLASSGCDFCWKGGTSLMVILGGSLHRLSIDVDIICPPGTDIEKYLAGYKEFGFIRREEDYRERRSADVPATHSKFHYQIAYNSSLQRTEYILLDVLYEESHYNKVNTVSIESPFVKWETIPPQVKVPSVEDILGDKLTAFAPNTSGIPYIKNGVNRSLEIMKQLYDIGRLFDKAEDISIIKKTYLQLVPVELSYRGLSPDPEMTLDDTVETAKCILSRGKQGLGDFASLQDGIIRLKSFMYQGKYYIENAICDAGKAAYLACIIKSNRGLLEKYDRTSPISPQKTTLPAAVSKLAIANPEAFFYWAKVFEILGNNGE